MDGGENLQPNNRAALKECIVFNNLDPESFDSLLSLFHEEQWQKNTCILHSEKVFFNFFIVLSGRIKMYQVDSRGDKEITLFILAKNDVFDLFCLLDGSRHDAYYECLDHVKVLAAPMAKVREWYQKHPEASKDLLPYAGKQLRMLENFVSDITFTDISTRILKLLIKNVKNNSNDLDLINGLSNKELGYLIGSTRTVVNRHLQRLKRNGCIRISRNRLEITDLSVLVHLLEQQQQKLKKDN